MKTFISRIVACSFLLRLVAGAPLFGLNPAKSFSQYVLRSWSEQTGLSQRSVMGIAQTPDGYIWLATEEGLVRYDGLQFRTFDEQNSPGLPDRLIRSLIAGRDGSLWIGTRSGLAKYRGGVFTSLVAQTAFSDDIYDLCESSDGSIWFSSDRGLLRFHNGQTRIYTTADGLPDNRITAIAQGADGSIWAGTRAGLVRFLARKECVEPPRSPGDCQEGGRFATFAFPNETIANSINALTVGFHGEVWIGTTSGEVDRWHAGRIEKWWRSPTHRSQIQCLREDRDGTLWIAFQHWGLGRMRGSNLELLTRQNGLPSDDPDWIFEDIERNMWFGWADRGFSIVRDGKFSTFGLSEGLSTDHASSVIEARDGSLWVGTEDGGLNRIRHGQVQTYSERNGLKGKDFVSVLQSRDGSIWSGSDRGILARIDGSHISIFGKPQSAPPRIAAMLEDRAGNLWIGFEENNGLARFRNGKFDRFGLKGRVKGLAEAPDGAVWVAADGLGVARVAPDSVRIFDEARGLSSHKAISIFVDRAGVVWAGTAQAGLNRIAGEKITNYSVGQGLFDSTVGSILEDGEYLWMTSTRGIFRILKQELTGFAEGRITSVHSESFGTADGLRSAECAIGAQPAAWKASDGTLLFATTSGLASVNPSLLLAPRSPPRANLDRVTYAGIVVPAGVNNLSAGLGRLEFDFKIPNFVEPSDVQVRYRLVGYDSNWVDAAGVRKATYTNLPPREYTFRVQAARQDNPAGFTETSYRFSLRPKYYQTLWFRLVAAIGVCLMIAQSFRIRMRILTARNRELELKVQSRTAELSKAVEEAEVARELLRDQATRDMLTGLWNRRAIFAGLEKEILFCDAGAGPLSVLMIDLDHFKSINDRLGHLAGDQVLREAAARFCRCIAGSEAVGRYGGEEFLVVLPGACAVSALKRAEQLRTALEQPLIATEAGDLRVTCSIGVSLIAPGQNARDLMAAADRALYDAKAAGRNCVRIHHPTANEVFEVADAQVLQPFR